MPKIEMSDTMDEFVQYLAKKYHCEPKEIIVEAILEYYREEWLEWRKLKEQEEQHE